MEQKYFEKLVQESLETLPEKIKKAMDNVAVVIEDRPLENQLKEVGVRQGDILLGFYEGVPKTVWGRGFGNTLPDKITIFKESIEKIANAPEDIKKIVKRVVRHEIAHHFGYSEKGIKEKNLETEKKK